MTAEFLVAAMLSTIVAIGASQAAGAWLARPHYRRINRLAREVLGSPDSTLDDRIAIRGELREMTKRWPIWLIAVFAPLASLPVAVAAIIDLARHRNISEAEMLAKSQRDYALLDQILGFSKKPHHSQSYLDRREAISDELFEGAILSSPLLAGWIFFWLLPTLLAFAVMGAADVAARRFRLMFETITAWISAQTTRVA